MDLDVKKPVQLVLVSVLLVWGLWTGLDTGVSMEEVRSVNKTKTIERTVGENASEREVSRVESIVENKSERFRKAKPLVEPDGYINTDNVSVEESIGEKVILLDMWTYSCINCQRTLPYIQGWYEDYRDDGLLVIGNHAPEFEFEKKRSNVEEAVERFNITYPVVLDNDKQTWFAYNNRYWPQKYLIGIDGFIRYEKIGEGGYNETESVIRRLLRERKRRLDLNITIESEDDRGVEEPEFERIETPEIYFGAERNEDYLANGRGYSTGVQELEIPETTGPDRLYLGGEWNFSSEYAEAVSEDATVYLNYSSKVVNMVASANETASARVFQDGNPIGSASGTDVSAGDLRVSEEMLYNIVLNEDYGRHELSMDVEPGFRAYTFTFG